MNRGLVHGTVSLLAACQYTIYLMQLVVTILESHLIEKVQEKNRQMAVACVERCTYI